MPSCKVYFANHGRNVRIGIYTERRCQSLPNPLSIHAIHRIGRVEVFLTSDKRTREGCFPCQKLQCELAYLDRKSDPRVAREERQRWKTIEKSLRASAQWQKKNRQG